MTIVICLQAPFVVAQGTPGGTRGRAAPAYEQEIWPPGRTLVWAHPGRSGAIDDPNWWTTQDGKAVTAAPDRNTDIVLPAGEQIYEVKGGRTNQVRHVTIEKNAVLTGGHRNEVEIWGNCRVKKDGHVKFISIRGDKHTFFRVEEAEFPNPSNGRVYMHPSRRLPLEEQSRSQISHKFQVCKYGTASVEFLGNAGVSDEVMLQHGKMIISGDFRYSGVTGKGAFEIYDGAILEIQSGGRLAPFVSANSKAVYNVNIYRNGVVQAGSPERPLTSDAHLLLGFAENGKPGRTGLYAALGSVVRVYTTDPGKARLVVSSITSVPGFCDGLGKMVANPQEGAKGNKGIAMQLAGDCRFDGAFFDYVAQGGLALSDPNDFKQWTGVQFGSHCAGPQGQLVSSMSVNPNAYYHNRGSDQESEYALTVKAIESMNTFLDQTDPFRISTSPSNTQMIPIGEGKKMDTPVAVVFDAPIEVTVNTRVPGARLRYTLDGTEPTKDSPEYMGPIRLNRTTQIMVKAYKTGVGFSPTYSTTYVFKETPPQMVYSSLSESSQ
jgi:hypothetical protein